MTGAITLGAVIIWFSAGRFRAGRFSGSSPRLSWRVRTMRMCGGAGFRRLRSISMGRLYARGLGFLRVRWRRFFRIWRIFPPRISVSWGRRRHERRRRPQESSALQQSEVNFDVGGDRDGLAVLCPGFEGPLLNGFDGFFVEAHAEPAHHLDIARHSVGSDFEGDTHGALDLYDAGQFAVLRLQRIRKCGRVHSLTYS